MRLKGRRIAERGEATVRNAWYTMTMLKNDSALAAMRRLSMLFLSLLSVKFQNCRLIHLHTEKRISKNVFNQIRPCSFFIPKKLETTKRVAVSL